MKKLPQATELSPLDDQLRAILNNARSYPLELTLSSGQKLRIPRRAFVHFPPRLKNIVYYPPRKSDGLFEFIAPNQVIKIRTRLRNRAA